MSPFSAIVTPSSIAFTAISGKPYNITASHISFQPIKELVKRYWAEPDRAEEIRAEMDRLAEPAMVINDAGKGRLYVQDGVVVFNGTPIHNTVTERIIWGMSEGYGMGSYLAFLDKLMDNPSKGAVDELYGFIEKHKMGIADDGDIVAYKKVREDYHDIHTGTFDNSPGQILDMPRNSVDDNRNRTCSQGFHFCAFEYLGQFGSGPGNRVVIVKVNPRDVVSIPSDHNDAKARCCHYEVIGEYTGDDLQDVLNKRPVWSDAALDDQFDWDREADDDDVSDGSDDCPECGEFINECICDDVLTVTENPDPEVYALSSSQISDLEYFRAQVARFPENEKLRKQLAIMENAFSIHGLIPTPCVGKCKIDENTGICLGCGRSNAEISGWKNMSETERRAIMHNLAQGTTQIMSHTKDARTKREGHYIVKVEMGETLSLLGGEIDVSRIIWDDGTVTYVSSDEEHDLYASLREQSDNGHKAKMVVK